MELRFSEIAEAIEGHTLQGAGGAAFGISTDSRKINPGELFFALKGQNFNGNLFVKDVFLKGASGAVVDEDVPLGGLSSSFNVIRVKDALASLGALASYIRGINKIPFVGISGSVGKTTTKEMIAAILGRSRNVLKTEGNRNNLIGLPLTIAGLKRHHEAAVLELGISEHWEMEKLVAICRPDVAVLTNIGRGHLKTLGNLEGVANAKGALFKALAPHGVKVVNLDDPWIVRLAGANGTRMTYSSRQEAEVRLLDCKIEAGFSGMEASYEVKGKKLSIRLSSPNVANAVNGAAAIAAAVALGAPLKDIEEGLSSYSPVRGRMDILKINGMTVLDDTYNANPESMAAALRTLKGAMGRKVAVMGDMLELGDISAREHFEAGRLAGELGIDAVVSIGEFSKDVANGAVSGGMKTGSVLAFRDRSEALTALRGVVKEGDSILVKASRGVALEYIVEGLKVAVPAQRQR